MSEGKVVRLGDVADLRGGYAFKSEQYTESGRFVLRTVNIQDDGSITRKGATYIAEAEAAEYQRFALEADDTLFVMVGATLGKIGFLRQTDLPALLNQNMWVIRAKDDAVDPIFLHYKFRELSKGTLAWVGGSARSFLRRDDVRNLEFFLPPITEQVRIGRLLKSLDDKIELTRRMNETLEEMTQALFRDWFVNFGPIRRKIAGAADPVEVMGGLVGDRDRAQQLADQFPKTLGNDGLPEGWSVGSLGDLAVVVSSTVAPTDVRPDTPYIGLEHMPRNSIALSEWGAASAVTSNKSSFKRGQILFGKLRPYFHKVGVAPIDGVCSTDIVVLAAKKKAAQPFVAACVASADFVSFADRGSTGTKMPRTSWASMKAYPIVVVDDGVMGRFSDVCSTMLEKITANVHEINKLVEIQNFLLPKLMSGKVTVQDAVASA